MRVGASDPAEPHADAAETPENSAPADVHPRGATCFASGGRTPLHVAVEEGHWEVAEQLLRGADSGAGDCRGRTPLHYAAWHGHREYLCDLLEAGVDSRPRDDRNRTPLHAVAIRGLRCARKLAGPLIAASGDRPPRSGAFLVFSLRSKKDATKGCWPRDAVPAAEDGGILGDRDENGWTPLHCAAAFCSAHAAEMLLEAGADPAAIDDRGRTPLQLAEEKQSWAVAEMLRGYSATPRGPSASCFARKQDPEEADEDPDRVGADFIEPRPLNIL